MGKPQDRNGGGSTILGRLGTFPGNRYRRAAMALLQIPWAEKLAYLEIYMAGWRYKTFDHVPVGELLDSIKRRQLLVEERVAIDRIDQIKNEAQHINKNTRVMSIPRPWGIFLLKLLRYLKPRVCLEMGTAFGISSMYQYAALKLNGDGLLYTLDGSESRMAIARRNLEKFGATSVKTILGLFEETLVPTLEGLGTIDFAFLDGNHEKAATLEHFSIVSRYLRSGALVLLDDIRWSAGMWEAWQTICRSSQVGFSADLQRMGLCTVL